MTLYYACVVLLFMDPYEQHPCVPISGPLSSDQCTAVIVDWVRRAEAWRARSGIRYYHPFSMCLPAEQDQA